jgi:hypothetical protein
MNPEIFALLMQLALSHRPGEDARRTLTAQGWRFRREGRVWAVSR